MVFKYFYLIMMTYFLADVGGYERKLKIKRISVTVNVKVIH